MTGFDKNWNNHSHGSVNDRLKDSLRPQMPLKPKIEGAVNKLQLQITKLDTMIAKINERDVSLFKRVVDSMQRHDSDTARILSNELGEVRKISRTLGQSKMALEQVSLRLTSIHDMGDAMAALGPAMASVKSLKTSLGRFVPGADTEINNLQSLLNNIMVESIHENGTGVDVNTGSGSDIDQILMEASAVAEQRVNDKFPSIPTSQYRKASASESEQ